MSDPKQARVRHRHNPELGTGRVLSVDDRVVVVQFPAAGTVLRISRDDDALIPVEILPGVRVRVEATGDEAVVERVPGDGTAVLGDGRSVPLDGLWPLGPGDSLFERLATGDVDPPEDVSLRLDALHLASVREADGLGSFLGGRIELFPHQLHVAERATRTDPVRWLLADEVGLGKTVEACLVLNHLVRTGRARRTLVVAPETLTVQWLGELWRKYHQVFVLLDDRRLADVERDFGTGFNPFEAHEQTVVSLERLRDNPWLVERAVEARIDLLIVDEAHHLRRARGHPGNAEYRAVRPISDLGRHVLLLTATPMEDDAHGFFRLLQLLRPDAYPEDESFDDRLTRREPLPPCTSATRRVDIGGLPPRTPAPVDLACDQAHASVRALEQAVRAMPAGDRLARRRKVERTRRALASGAALAAIVDGSERDLAEAAARADDDDPRLDWLAGRAREWRDLRQKTLVFVAHRESLELVRRELSRRSQIRCGVFHEELSAARRDIEVAQFRTAPGPSILVSTECGGEGRNFQFCHRLVMYDLPWDPAVVEQRIGRLDRIGRRIPVEIVYFRPPDGLGRQVARLYERLGLFEEPLGGLLREITAVGPAIRRAAARGQDRLEPETVERLLRITHQARDRVREAAYHELHRDPYRPEMAGAILNRVPVDLEDLTEDGVVAACERLGLSIDPHRDGRVWSVEFGNRAVVDSLPGVAAGSSFLGTFERRVAVEDETIDFYASGHPLVEGLLAHLDESPLGRVGLLHVRGEAEEALGLLAIYRRAPAGSGAARAASDAGEGQLDVVAVDLHGRDRLDWAALVERRPLRTKRVRPDDWVRVPGWTVLIRSLARRLQRPDRPEAVLALRVGG